MKGAIILAAAMVAAAPASAEDHPAHAVPAPGRSLAAQAASSRTRDAVLGANQIGLTISNQGQFAVGHHRGDAGLDPGLEFPRGSGKDAGFAGGLWITGDSGGGPLGAIAEYGSEFVPGNIVGDSAVTDTARFRVFSASPYDTTGWGAWAGIGGPLGAPVFNGTADIPGDQGIWTIFNDATSFPDVPVRGGARLSSPIGIEVRLAAWEFHRDGPSDRIAFLSYVLANRGTTVLTNARLGLFLDPHVSTGYQFCAVDTSLDMGYSFHDGFDNLYGNAGPAVGLVMIEPPYDLTRHAKLRPSSFLAYQNGTDPATLGEFINTMSGLYPSGAAIVDSSTMQPTPFFSSGDPVAGTGWVHSSMENPHTVLGMGPFTLSPGDSVWFLAALVIGQGTDNLSAVTDLRNSATFARGLYAGRTYIPPFAVTPIRSWPNPTAAGATFSYAIGSSPQSVELWVIDLSGRRVRHWPAEVQAPGSHQASWDGTDDHGRRVRPGLYLVRVRAGEMESAARVVVVR